MIAGFRSRIEAARTRYWLRACERVGRGASLEGRPTIAAQGRIRIGDRFRLASLPVPSHLVAGPSGALTIGDDVAIGHGAAITAVAHVEIGDGTRIGPNVIVIDTDFHVVGDAHAPAQTTPIVVGRRVRIGSSVVVLRGSRIEDDAEVEAGSVVAGVVPKGTKVSGVPARAASATRPADAQNARVSAAGVAEVVQRSFGLPSLPAEADGPKQIPHWDSLGALKLLLALEDTFDVALGEQDLLRVTSVGDLSDVVVRVAAEQHARRVAANG